MEASQVYFDEGTIIYFCEKSVVKLLKVSDFLTLFLCSVYRRKIKLAL